MLNYKINFLQSDKKKISNQQYHEEEDEEDKEDDEEEEKKKEREYPTAFLYPQSVRRKRKSTQISCSFIFHQTVTSTHMRLLWILMRSSVTYAWSNVAQSTFLGYTKHLSIFIWKKNNDEYCAYRINTSRAAPFAYQQTAVFIPWYSILSLKSMFLHNNGLIQTITYSNYTWIPPFEVDREIRCKIQTSHKLINAY